MIDCYNFEDYITAYMENELSESDKKEFEEILKSNLSCRTKFDEVENLIENLHSLPKLKTSRNFQVSLNEKINAEDNRKSFFSDRIKSYLYFKPNFGFAISVCLLFVGSYLLINNYTTLKTFTVDSNTTNNMKADEEIYFSDIDSTEQNDEYEGEILQTSGEK